jgi:hypothetical protein
MEYYRQIGNYEGLIYLLYSEYLNGSMNVGKVLDYITDGEICNPESHLKLGKVLGKGAYGEVSELDFCEKDCGSLSSFYNSYGKNNVFGVSHVGLVSKKSQIPKNGLLKGYEDFFDPSGRLVSGPLPPEHHSIPDQIMNVFLDPFVTLLYRNGVNPHVVQTFGQYYCPSTSQLYTIMEKVNGKNVESYFFGNDSSILLMPPTSYEIHMFLTMITQFLYSTLSLHQELGISQMDSHLENVLMDDFAKGNVGEHYYNGYPTHYYDWIQYDINGIKYSFPIIDNKIAKITDFGLGVMDSTHRRINPSSFRMSVLGVDYVDSYRNTVVNDTIHIHPEFIKAFNNPQYNAENRQNNYSNCVKDYFEGRTDGMAWEFLSKLYYKIDETYKKRRRYNEIKNILYSFFVSLEPEYTNPLNKVIGTRRGFGKIEVFVEKWLNYLQRINYIINDPDGSKRFVFQHQPTYILKLEPLLQYQGESIDFALKSLDTKKRCPLCPNDEYEKYNPQKLPERSVKEKDINHISPLFELIHYEIPNELLPTYRSQTLLSGMVALPNRLIGKKLKNVSYYVIDICRKSKVSANINQDIYNVAKSDHNNSIVVNGGYFVIKTNLDDEYNPVREPYYTPIGASYIKDKSYKSSVPFPPAYNNDLRYIFMKTDDLSKTLIYTHDELSRWYPNQYIEKTFKYQLINKEYFFETTCKVFDLEQICYEMNMDIAFTSGPCLLERKEYVEKIFDYNRINEEFKISQDDVDNVIRITDKNNRPIQIGSNVGDVIDPNLFLDQSYRITPNASSYMWKLNTTDRVFHTHYGMNHSNVLMEHNVFVITKDSQGNKGFYVYLFEARGYGSDGIPRYEIGNLLSKLHSEDEVYAVSLDGGFSANAVYRDRNKLHYVLNEPIKRNVGISLKFY